MRNKKARVSFSFCSVSILADFTLFYVFNFSGRFQTRREILSRSRRCRKISRTWEKKNKSIPREERLLWPKQKNVIYIIYIYMCVCVCVCVCGVCMCIYMYICKITSEITVFFAVIVSQQSRPK